MMEDALSSHNPYLLLPTQSPDLGYLLAQQETMDQLRSGAEENSTVLRDSSGSRRGVLSGGGEYLTPDVPVENICLDSWCNKGGRFWDLGFKSGDVSYNDAESNYSQISCQSNTSFFTEATRQNKSLQRSPGFNSPVESRGWMDHFCGSGQGDPALWFGLMPSREGPWQEPITQKLDSFSEAFLSQRRGGFSLHPGANPSRPQWRVGRAEARTSCVLDSSSSPSPTLPSPPAHLMSYVLSPPPTPLTPPSLSPPNLGSPVGTPSQAADTFLFFPSHRPPLTRPCGRKDPVLEYGNSSYSLSDLHSPENQLFLSPSVHPSCSLPAPQYDPAGLIRTHKRGHKRNNVLQSQEPPFDVTGVPFASILHSCDRPSRVHYTPRPMLNPARQGPGLFSSICPQPGVDQWEGRGEEEGERWIVSINVGDEFQAKLPACSKDSAVTSRLKEPSREDLLWRPHLDLEGNSALKNHAEKLLLMCSSSCLPGGGSNTELALHCMHCCKGDVMMTLEMLMFTLPSPSGDYHYSGSDVWTEVEKKCFSSSLRIYGKDFSFIQKSIKSKSVSQCVEFYYLSVKPQQKRQKLEKESRRAAETSLMIKHGPFAGQLANTTFEPELVPPGPQLTSFYPCKLCGKMFYKIKSRNAHMKIHRQPQEDLSDLRPPRLASGLLLGHSSLSRSATTFLPSGYMPYPSAELSGAQFLNLENVSSNEKLIQLHPKNRDLVLHQDWKSEGLDPITFYCSPEGRNAAGAAEEEPVSWQL